MCGATSRLPYMGILSILFITLTVGPADADLPIGYDCRSGIQKKITISIVDLDDSDLDIDKVETSPEDTALLQRRKDLLKNNLPMAITHPDEFAFRFMEGPGYMAVSAGEVIHILQCSPVEVKVNRLDKCYNRLPVLRGNQSVFLTPKTHIITNRATEISCNSPLQVHYKLEGDWYKFVPEPVDAEPPIKLSTKMSWTYAENPAVLASSGIYTQKNLDSMREQIMFPLEERAITGTIVQQFADGMGGKAFLKNTGNDNIWNALFSTTWSKIAAGIIGVFIFLQMITFLLDVVINAYLLYSRYGWSIRLFSAFWNSLAKKYLLETEQGKKEKGIYNATQLA